MWPRQGRTICQLPGALRPGLYCSAVEETGRPAAAADGFKQNRRRAGQSFSGEERMQVVDRVSMLLQRKGHEIFSLPSDASVYSAIELMAEKGVGALLVFDERRLAGIISERDYARKIILQGRSSKDTFVREIMTLAPVWVAPHHTVAHCLEIMTNRRIRHLPVLEHGKVAGILSIG